jgi:hypothetical protein
MPWNGDVSELRSGASNDPDDPMFAHEFGGISQAQAARIADAILADDAAPSTTPLRPAPSSGVPQGYGKWGDLA